jgi:hypothetical protein
MGRDASIELWIDAGYSETKDQGHGKGTSGVWSVG